jgi:RNA polymerase sigma-70 factor (ECF subfamily)
MTVAVQWASARRRHAGWRGRLFDLARKRGPLASRPPRTAEAETAPNTRQRLLSLPGGGGDDAFEAFFRTHERAIFGYLCRMTGDEQASYDLSQETFVRAWQQFERVRGYEQPRAWLFRVATNLARNHRRHRSIRDAATVRLVSSGEAAGDMSSAVAESDAVRAALDTLPVKQRAALVLRVVYGLSLGELAQALGASEAATKMTLSRARGRFRAHYTEEERR